MTTLPPSSTVPTSPPDAEPPNRPETRASTQVAAESAAAGASAAAADRPAAASADRPAVEKGGTGSHRKPGTGKTQKTSTGNQTGKHGASTALHPVADKSVANAATATAITALPPESLTWWGKVRRAVIGKPRDLADRSVFHTLALIPVLAWIGLGADALSSSAYGPEEAFKALQGHTYLAVALALATALTVAMISAAYSALIENFPNGGGYGVATRLLGSRVGLISGCALLVDYVLTITTSIAAAGDAIYSFLPDFRLWPEFSILGLTIGAGPDMLTTKLPFEVGLLGLLTVLNLRGVKESVVVLTPMFLLFVVTHLVLLVAGFLCHIPQMPATVQTVGDGFHEGYKVMGLGGLALLLARAYSLGGGTYTGIEAVSNALPLLREPRVANAQRTMLYLAVSLAVTAGGLVLLYLLWGTTHQEGQTMNAVLAVQVTQGWPGASTFVVLTLLSEATLLVVAAQAGFLGGPRVLANMAVDSWLPHSFSSISERLTTENGVLLMAGAALGALLYTKGSVDTLVVMYSINVFVTFSLTMAGMMLFWLREKAKPNLRIKRLVLFGCSFALCAIILCVTVWSKFSEGGWTTLAVTGLLILACMGIRWHYRVINGKAAKLYADLGRLPLAPPGTPSLPLRNDQPTAVILVAAYGGLGIHTLLNVMRIFPGHYHQVVFLSVGVVDSGNFKGEDSLDALRARTNDSLDRYVRLATALKIPATSRMGDGIDAVDTAEALCLEIAAEFPRAVFFAGKLVFRNESWYHRLLHNNTAIALQKRLHWAGKAMVVMPARIQ